MLEMISQGLDAMVGNINFEGIEEDGDDNVLGIAQTIFIWFAIFVVIFLMVKKFYRGAIAALLVFGIVGVFVYDPDLIESMGRSILEFFGIIDDA